MNAMKNKIKSRRGASITFALLLFLVCAVVSGIVIVAATAASGRMDQIAESDQRYYAVTSAAELLKDALDGKTVTVKTVETSIVTQSHNGDTVTETPDPSEDAKEVKMWYGDAESTAPTLTEDTIKALSVLGDAAYRVANAEYKKLQTPAEGETAKELVIAPIPPDISGGRQLTLTATGVSDETVTGAFSVDIVEQATSNGIVNFFVSKADAKDPNKAYTLKLSFKADVKTTADKQTTTGTPTNVSADGTKYDIVETTTSTIETTMIWTLTDIVKAVKPVLG